MEKTGASKTPEALLGTQDSPQQFGFLIWGPWNCPGVSFARTWELWGEWSMLGVVPGKGGW